MVQAIEDMGELDNTLIFYEVGDNGASAEGGMSGMFNEMTYFNGVAETVPDMLKNIDKWGGPDTFPHMAAGWAVAGNTPFMWTKQVAANFGGTRNPLVVSWPARIKAKGEIRSQFHHVIDIAPTVLEAAKLPEPKTVNGVAQAPMEGVSMAYTFDDAKAADRHKTQYFEIFGNRAIYHDGWVAATVHKAPWEAAPRRAARRRHLGALQRRRGFQPDQRPREVESRQAQGDAGAVHDRSREVSRAADRRSHRSSVSIRPWRAGPISWPAARR